MEFKISDHEVSLRDRIETAKESPEMFIQPYLG